MSLYSNAIPRCEEYAVRRAKSIEKQLGGGIQGVVFSTTAGTALKSFIRSEFYQRERNVYLRLQEREVESIEGFWVPKILDFHDELLVIEMEIVSPPYVLDFASAYLDETPPYADSAEIMAEWIESKQEQFEENWPIVEKVIASFRRLGIYLSDVKPGNITFAE